MKVVVAILISVLFIAILDIEAKKKSKKQKKQVNVVCKKDDITELQNSIAELKSDLSGLEAKLLNKSCEKVINETTHNDRQVKDVITKHGKTFQAVCKDGWLSIARRFDGSVDFYRTWQEYKKGFGDPRGEYFIGLENLVDLLSQGPFSLRVELTSWPPTEIRFAEYSTFKVAGESDKYRLTIGGYSGTATDSMAEHNGMAFSTKDMDNDVYGSNCAVLFTGAWWYSGCHHSNLFGYYFQQAKSEYGQGITWYNWKGDYYSFKEVDMKVNTQC